MRRINYVSWKEFKGLLWPLRPHEHWAQRERLLCAKPNGDYPIPVFVPAIQNDGPINISNFDTSCPFHCCFIRFNSFARGPADQ
jgi:hypothetical protein